MLFLYVKHWILSFLSDSGWRVFLLKQEHITSGYITKENDTSPANSH